VNEGVIDCVVINHRWRLMMMNRMMGMGLLVAAMGIGVVGPARAGTVVLTPAGTMFRPVAPVSSAVPAYSQTQVIDGPIIDDPVVDNPLVPLPILLPVTPVAIVFPRDLAAEEAFAAKWGLRNNPERVWTEQEIRDAAKTTLANSPSQAKSNAISAPSPAGSAPLAVKSNQNLRVIVESGQGSSLSTSRVFPVTIP
jgi:hypothetical protein